MYRKCSVNTGHKTNVLELQFGTTMVVPKVMSTFILQSNEYIYTHPNYAVKSRHLITFLENLYPDLCISASVAAS
jgi:hypothetical protein